MTSVALLTSSKFLSTPSARRATITGTAEKPAPYISIHALREEGDFFEYGLFAQICISIHALREEGDLREPAR